MRALASVAAAAWLLATPAAAHQKDKEPPEVEAVELDEAKPEGQEAHGEKPEAAKPEAVEAVEVVAAEEGDEGAASFPDLLGRLHPSLVHFPIGWLTLAFLLDLGAIALRRQELERTGRYAVGLALLSFIPAAATGFLRLGHLAEEGAEMDMAFAHRNAMLTTAIICLVAVVIRWTRKHGLAGGWRVGYLALLTLAVVFLTIGSHLGGELVFGEDFLPW